MITGLVSNSAGAYFGFLLESAAGRCVRARQALETLMSRSPFSKAAFFEGRDEYF
jgi:hypothetical protein